MFDGPLADWPRLFAERRKRVFTVWSVAEKRVTELAVRRQQFQAFLQHAPDAVLELLLAGEHLQYRFVATLLHLVIESQHNGFLGREVVISAAESDSGFGSNVTHGGLLKTLFAERFHRGFIDAPARIFRARRRTCFHCGYIHRR